MKKASPALQRRYVFEYDVGRWTFGTLQVLRDRETGQMKNCKAVPKANLRVQGNPMAHLRALMELRHPHLSNSTDVLEDDMAYYVMSDLCAGGDVQDWLERMDETNWLQEQTCASYVRQVVLALAHCHSQGVFHRDLRPSEIMMTSKLPDASVKVSDVGLASVFDPDNRLVQAQPSAYVAPEILESSEMVRTGAADIWSVGAIAHALLIGHSPKEGSDASGWGLASKVRSGEDGLCERSSLSRDFLARCLRPAHERPTAAQALQHPWLKGLIPIGGVHVRADNEIAREARHKTLCYTLAIIMVPLLVPYRDFEQLRSAFQQSDMDRDGFIPTASVGQRLLLQRCSLAEAVAAAISIADIGKEEVMDLCAAAVADLIAREFFAAGPTGAPLAGPLRATDLAPRMLKRFVEVFGDRQRAIVTGNGIRSKLRTATTREFEMHAGVHYDELLACLPEDQPLDSQALAAQLSINAGRGTPLAGARDLPQLQEDFYSAWSPASLFGIDLSSFLRSCGANHSDPGSPGRRRSGSPHSMQLY
eukprot:TRINITY_DN39754_c0_g1_i1.p1 TRINITY_DN39754_c0_g1~~TRINITY_DN39754_c0_g1_i1.p1  ORF type:complete len:534 (-),score=102.49 TRINITY_DN39754_c0_g1_i1:226-1827(-)